MSDSSKKVSGKGIRIDGSCINCKGTTCTCPDYVKADGTMVWTSVTANGGKTCPTCKGNGYV